MKDWEWKYVEEQLSWGRSVSELVSEGYPEEEVSEAAEYVRDSLSYYDAVDWAWNHR